MNKIYNKLFTFLFFIFLTNSTLFAQAQKLNNSSEEIVAVPEEMPRFPGCEGLATVEEKKACADKKMLSFIYKNITYPLEARKNGNQGSVVLSFIVERDSTISEPKILRGVEGGCSEEALRVINLMNEQGLKWSPGKLHGKAVRTSFTVPIRFKLEEEPVYTFIDRDTVYTKWETPLSYKGGQKALDQYIKENLNYPAAGNDSCRVGIIELQALVQPDDLVKVVNLIDYQDLGIDYQFEVIDLITGTMGQWKQAVMDGRKVPTTYPIRISFLPTAETCKQVVDDFEKAEALATEGIKLYNEGTDKEEALKKLGEAINLFPDNADYLYSRGMIFMNEGKMEAACADLSKAKQIMMVTWFDNLIPIICK